MELLHYSQCACMYLCCSVNQFISLTTVFTYKDGQLWCIVCDNIVKSDAVWPIHINSKKHKDNISKKKSAPVQIDVKQNGASLKRPAETPAPLPPPPKQIKSKFSST